MLDLVQTLHELVGESLDPFNVLFLYLKQRVSNFTLPLGYNVNVWRVLFDRLGCVCFY